MQRTSTTAVQLRSPAIVEFALYFTALLWSFSGVLIKVYLREVDELVIAGTRGCISAIVAFLYLYAREERYRVPRLPAQWVAAIFFTANTILLVYAFKLTTVANAVFLHFSGMGIAAALAPRFLGEKSTWTGWLSIAIIALGMAALGFDPSQGTALGNVLGIFCGLTLATESIAFRFVARAEGEARDATASNEISKPAHSLILHAIILSDLLTCAISIAGVAILRPTNISIAQHWLPLLVLGIVPWAVPNILYCWIVREIPSLVKAMIAWSIDPVFTSIWAFLASRQYPTGNEWLGCGLIFIGVLFSRVVEAITTKKDSPEVEVSASAAAAGPEA